MRKFIFQRIYFFSVLIALLLAFAAQSSNAHGGDKPGPHGGQIEMPGAFHTEVVADADGFKVYLLDIKFENPSVKDSSVRVELKSDQTRVSSACEKRLDYFFCRTGKNVSKGTLVVKAVRENAKGNDANYSLPLKYK
ncbi:MAG: hypothetical protein ACXWC9_05560 [Pseudobdellovibrionaceae bacterium]